MAAPPRAPTESELIGGVFRIDFATPLPGAAPPHTAYAARRFDQGGFMAVTVARGAPARARALDALKGVVTHNLLYPLAHGPATAPDGATGYFIICPAPPGPSLAAAPRVWIEAEVMANVLKPAALVLADLHAHNVTHRAIRADNLFQAGNHAPVTLGCAWAAPPACHQPAWMEPPYSAVCLPSGRGGGAIADDVYALGALIVSLLLGGPPDQPDDAVLRRKLDAGSYAALVGDRRLPQGLATLLQTMLADEPDHRPSPAMLLNPAARTRRVAARAPTRAQRAIEIGSASANTVRTLAYAMIQQPDAAITALRNGLVDRWLRRLLVDPVIAAQVDEAVRARDNQAASGDPRADAMMLTRVIATLDPGAPLVWRSVTLWPDGLGPALDHLLRTDRTKADMLTEIITSQVGLLWNELRGGRDAAVSRLEAMEVRTWLSASNAGTSALRLAYSLNPLAPCESALTARAWVLRLGDLLPAMEAASTGPRNGQVLADPAVAAFIAAHRDERLDSDLNRLASSIRPDDLLAQVRLLARLQAKLSAPRLPQLGAWVDDALRPLLTRYGSKTRRDRLGATLAKLCRAGDLPKVVALLDDDTERAEDRSGLDAARQRLAAIDASLAQLSGAATRIAAQAQRTGHDAASGLALLACAGAACFGLLF